MFPDLQYLHCLEFARPYWAMLVSFNRGALPCSLFEYNLADDPHLVDQVAHMSR